jgi:hypothetical protein
LEAAKNLLNEIKNRSENERVEVVTKIYSLKAEIID